MTDEKISCGYFTGKRVPAGCRGTLSYMLNLATALHKKHYPENTAWKPDAGNMGGLLLQIDNMTSGLSRHPDLLAENEALRAALETARLRFEMLAIGHPDASAEVGEKEAATALSKTEKET